METPGFSIWIVLILIAFLFLFMWGALFFFIAIGTWLIARTRLRDEPTRPRRDWEDPGF